VVGLRHEERQREIEHEKKLDEAWSKTDKGKGKYSSKPKFLNCKGNRKKHYDKRQMKTRFSDISKFQDNNEPKRIYHNKEDALKGILALLLKIRK
jgi:hypothetical protein